MAEQEQTQEVSIEQVEKKTRKPRKIGVNKTTGELSLWWTKFFDRIKNFQSVEMSEWEDHELLGYLCFKYKETYGHGPSFSLKGSPSKCEEMFAIKKIKMVMNNKSPKFIKDYIDWVFENKLGDNKTKVVSMAFFMIPGICNEFKHYRIKKKKITRSTQLPADMLQGLSDAHHPEIVTYGDVAFIKLAVDGSANQEDVAEYKELLDLLERYCLDLNILNSLEG